MRILLVQSTTKYPHRKPRRSRRRWVLGITLPYLAALTPKGVQVDLVDDRLMPIPYHRTYDLVGITCTCGTTDRAYEIAGEFRSRGVPVVIGGVTLSEVLFLPIYLPPPAHAADKVYLCGTAQQPFLPLGRSPQDQPVAFYELEVIE